MYSQDDNPTEKTKIMKTIFLLLVLLLLSPEIFAQSKPVKIVFDVTSSNVEVHQATIRHVGMMSEEYPDSEFEVVLYGGSIDMVLTGKSAVTEEVKMLAAKDNVSFVICEFTLKRKNVPISQLIPGVGTVPDGIMELVLKQQEGWGYIKEAF